MSLAPRVFTVAALACAGAWLLKTGLIAANGGTQTDGGVIGVLWALGMLSYLVSAAAGAVALLHRHPLWLRIAAGVAAVPVAFLLLNVVDGIAHSAYPGSGWFRDELALVVVGVVVAALGLTVLRRRSSSVLT